MGPSRVLEFFLYPHLGDGCVFTCVNIHRAVLFVHFTVCSFTSVTTEQVKKLKIKICPMAEGLSLSSQWR